ncbi:MAG: 8-amino-7-oxononanoate synthase, partial [Hyphomicrobiales bacterium]|nr:8-amino-7-oxononanoate synthase [Hyphomicrobiales bacterium]
MLMIDDAHGLGVLGATGRGLFERQSVNPASVDLWLGTLSKTLVSCGGYVAGSEIAIDLLKHHAPGFVYSVGMPAGAAAASLQALAIMRREPERVRRLQERSRFFQSCAAKAGLDTAKCWGAGIIPVVVGDTLRALSLSERLLERGVNAFPIVPPGVPERTARLRFFISEAHSEEEIEAAVKATAEELASLRTVSLDGALRR